MDEPESLNPYQLLMRQSRKMGRVASGSLDATKTFLKQDVSTLRPSQLLKSTEEGVTVNEKTDDTLQEVVARAHEILAKAWTVILPTNLFSDSVVVDRTKVSITKRTFFWSAEVISIRIEDVLNVSTNVGPLFGSLTIASRVMSSTDHFTINYFWRSDAIRLKHILQGYVIALHNNIDIKNLSRDELTATLIELGQD